MGDFYSWGLPVGSIAGIRIKLHWVLLLFWLNELIELRNAVSESRSDTNAFFLWALFVGLMFFIILLHEFGHCFAARAVGGNADRILLWPLGGLAFVDAPNLPRPQLIVAAGGPAVNLVIAAVAWPLFLGFERAIDPGGPFFNIYAYIARDVLVTWNLYLLVFNLIPLYPLDGGRMFHALLWGLLARRGGFGMGPYYRATMATVWASRVTAVAGILYGLAGGGGGRFGFFLIIIMIWAWFAAEGLRKRVEQGVGPDYSFGYDFSRGYTSLEGPRRTRRGGGGFFRRLFARRQRGSSAADARRLDEILEKIHREGMGALTRGERRFLEKMSRRKTGE